MNNDNSNIYEYLDYYTNLKTAPHFAVLLTGMWGSGKSWLINDYITSRKSKNKIFVNISLNGTQATNEIAIRILEALYPFIQGKAARIARRATSILSKLTLNKLFGNSPTDEDVASILSELGVNPQKHILVFDDLERCSIPIVARLGYITQYVEHKSFKVILVANEGELMPPTTTSNADAENNRIREYSMIKEKLIGKTLAIQPQYDAAISSFLRNLDRDDTARTIEQHSDLMKDIYQRSTYENLRLMRYAIMELARLIAALAPAHTQNHDLMSALIGHYLVYSLESQSGHIEPDGINALRQSTYSSIVARALGREQTEETKLTVIARKYSNIDIDSPIVPDECWTDIFMRGHIEPAKFNDALASSRFYNEDVPEWKQILHIWSLSNDEFVGLLKAVRSQFEGMGLESAGAVKHISGLLLWLSQNDLVDMSPESIVNIAKRQIDQLMARDSLNGVLDDYGHIYPDEEHGGYSYWGQDITEFDTIRAYTKEQAILAWTAKLSAKSHLLLEAMVDDIGFYIRSLTQTNSPDNKYYNVPILTYIDPAAYVHQFMLASRDHWRSIMRVFIDRYSSNSQLSKLVAEGPWLESIEALFCEEAAKQPGTLDGYRIAKIVAEYIKPSIATLNTLRAGDIEDTQSNDE